MTDSPAEAAITAAIQAGRLAVEPHESERLTRLVARRLPAAADTATAALCELRCKGWTSRLVDLSQRAGAIWVRREDAAEAAFEAVLGEVFDNSGRVLSASQHETLTRLVAAAFGLPADAPFVADMLAREAARRQERKAAESASRGRRRGELQRLRDWERSLVKFRAVPGLLGCTAKEALRWVAANRLPVARRVPQKDMPGSERWEFDPAELIRLRPEVALWQQEQPDAARPAVVRGGGKVANAAVARVAALDRYAAHFATARALHRRITLVTGPTNSGKSHAALERLAATPSGLALAPLRLLAYEFREALAARGVLASLATGEERMEVPGSRHLAATVEMCPLHNLVDVAVFDEAQMLHDPDRGAAWTAAIMGAPARALFVLGSPDCVPMVRRIAELCGDPLDEITLERKGPLVAATDPVPLGDLERGDALIAFSRRDVLDLRAALQARGRRVAVVYGALSPEVRRAEAARFNDGDADILIATDAIGMGLNLNIRRVVFGALRKFDGRQSRDLQPHEIKQIGGRAGRFGRHETGIVAVLAGAGSPSFVRTMLAAPQLQHAELRPLVQPDADIIRAVADEIGSNSLFGVLARIRRAVLRRDDPNYRLADMGQAFEVATALEGVAGLGLEQRWTYAMCPIDERDNGIPRLACWAAEHAAGRSVPVPSGSRLPPPERASRDELERAEKWHKRLVAWRWLALRFADAYPAREEAEALTARLNSWIEAVLSQQARSVPAVAKTRRRRKQG